MRVITRFEFPLYTVISSTMTPSRYNRARNTLALCDNKTTIIFLPRRLLISLSLYLHVYSNTIIERLYQFEFEGHSNGYLLRVIVLISVKRYIKKVVKLWLFLFHFYSIYLLHLNFKMASWAYWVIDYKSSEQTLIKQKRSILEAAR